MPPLRFLGFQEQPTNPYTHITVEILNNLAFIKRTASSEDRKLVTDFLDNLAEQIGPHNVRCSHMYRSIADFIAELGMDLPEPIVPDDPPDPNLPDSDPFEPEEYPDDQT